MTMIDTETAIEQYRVAMIEELGFSSEDATKLSEAFQQTIVKQKGRPTKVYDQRVDHHYLRSLLESGATHEQILRIVL